MRLRALVLLLSFLLAVAAPALAQSGPAPLMQIIREEVKVGKGAAHEKIEAGWPRAFAKAKWPYSYVALDSVTGPREAWFVARWSSFADYEKSMAEESANAVLQAELQALSTQDGEAINSSRNILAQYRPGLSHNPRPGMAGVRFMRVYTIRIRPGREQEFAEIVTLYKDALGKSDPDAHWGTYQVVTGMPGPTYIAFVSMKSLAEMGPNPEMERKMMEALGEESAKKLARLSSDSTISTEINLFAVSPKMSYVTTEFAAVEPDFWHPKPKPAVAKKEAAKIGTP